MQFYVILITNYLRVCGCVCGVTVVPTTIYMCTNICSFETVFISFLYVLSNVCVYCCLHILNMNEMVCCGDGVQS